MSAPPPTRRMGQAPKGGGGRRKSRADSMVLRHVMRCFPALDARRGRYGAAVLVAVVEAAGGRPNVRVRRRESIARGPGGRPRQRLLESVSDGSMGLVLVGLAQRQRIRIARAILSGANTHAGLSRAVRLAPGPLYHHLRTLERGGLVAFVERNRYDLTPMGRDLLLALTTVIGSAVDERVRTTRRHR